MGMRNNILFIIDPQNSFMGYGNGTPYHEVAAGRTEAAELPVRGAVEDMDRLSKFIDRADGGNSIDDIIVTLDTHETLFKYRDIGHPHYWLDAAGKMPVPFTVITFQDVVEKKWTPYDPGLSEKVLNYFSKAGSQVIWPKHCVLGTWGHDIYSPLNSAIQRWSDRTGKNPQVIRKGMNCHTEQYGAFEAAVPDPDDPTTQFNWTLLNHLKKGRRVWVAGEAESHCVKTSVVQAAAKLSPREFSKLTLLTDCMSSVRGFESAGDEFIAHMQKLGMNIAKVDA